MIKHISTWTALLAIPAWLGCGQADRPSGEKPGSGSSPSSVAGAGSNSVTPSATAPSSDSIGGPVFAAGSATASATGSGAGSPPIASSPTKLSIAVSRSPAGPGETVENLRRVKRGMTPDQVWAVLGQPERSEDTGAAVIYYLKGGSLVFFQQGKLVNAVLSTGQSLDNPGSLK